MVSPPKLDLWFTTACDYLFPNPNKTVLVFSFFIFPFFADFIFEFKHLNIRGGWGSANPPVTLRSLI